MKDNKELDLAWDFVNKTNRSLFLTGKAGTGKTTFLHRLKRDSLKRLVVVAPTGVAAINAKGVTIHSFFQVPFGPILPNTDLFSNTSFQRKFNKTKINIIKSMDLLVIDEISMVRADLLDAIDNTLRHFRDRSKVFGGVQILMIGDLQQLSPVVKDNEWELLRPYYKNAFFFSSQAYLNCNPVCIELKFIYRQADPKFISILNEVRNNELSEALATELNKRYIPNFVPEPNAGYIALTTHNDRAELTNNTELSKLTTKSYKYKAKVEGTFPEYAYPNLEILELKIGAQVMFVKNDSGPEKRYFNGKIGKVILLEKDEVVVHCPDDDFNIVTKPEIWENINYTIDAETKDITENKIGSYTQIPLRLAWAITIHKSQGLTFERAIIDTEGAFAHGQTYVALSRCKSLEGLVLKSEIKSNQIISDDNVQVFNKNSEANTPDTNVLLHFQKLFQLDLILEVFNYFEFLNPINRLIDLFYKNRSVIIGDLESSLLKIKDSITNLLKVRNAFSSQLKSISKDEKIPESSEIIQERFVKAISYFKNETQNQIIDVLKAITFTTDNTALENDMYKHLDALEDLLSIKTYYFKELENGFNTKKFLELRAKSVFITKEKTRKVRSNIVDGTSNIALYEQLRVLRNDIANEQSLVHFQVFTQKALYEMCEMLPVTKAELKKINGMGKVRIEKYGNAILEVIKSFCIENDIEISNNNFEENKTPVRKGDTKKISLKLFESGKNVSEIAEARGLNEATIFGHLASFITSGEVKITDLISKKHHDDLLKIIPTKTFDSLSDLKNQLDDIYSYEEIRLVLNSMQQ